MRFALFSLALLLTAGLLVAQSDADHDQATKKEELTLERLFPKKSFFGPRARDAAFSHDGKYAAWLHRPWKERRHGDDLYVMEVATGKTHRVTKVSVMSKFQKKTREVAEDRAKKAKAAAKAKKDKDEKEEKKKEAGEKEKPAADEVSDEDADDKKAPRYGGVQSFDWAPHGNELIFASAGDLYRVTMGQEEIERLTATRSTSETRFEWLPDGSGFVYMKDGLRRVLFGAHLVEEIDPELSGGRKMSSFAISPDGKKIAILAYEGERSWNGKRKVKIANYRDRFMKVREVSRTVSDDPIANRKDHVYIWEPGSSGSEKGELSEVWTHENTGPRDIIRTPVWSPDSQRIAFFEFTQKTETGRLVQVRLLAPSDAGKSKSKLKPESGGDEKKSTAATDENDDKKAKPQKDEAKRVAVDVVYEFRHDGGPTTPRMMTPWFTADSKKIAMLSEISGFRHVHVFDPLYQSSRQLTQGYYEVYPFAISKDHRRLFATASRESAERQDLYSIDLESGAMTLINVEGGFLDDAAVRDDGQVALANFTRFGSPRELVMIDAEKKKQHALTDSHPKEAHEVTQARPEFFEYENRHGHRIQGMMFKPENLAPQQKRPLLIYVYGGPLGTRRVVHEGNFQGDAYFFARYMTEKHGYITATIDPRGMSGYGGAFEKANFEQVGKPQVEDLVDGASFLIEKHQADREKIGLHGWSFGGFQTQMCLYTQPGFFRCGMAGAGPTEWENYNAWYSTGTIGTSRTGNPDLEKFSLLPLAKNLEDELLLVHGMEDPNVLYQDTVRVYRELLKAGKETLVELFLDPTGGHGLGGDVKRINRARKYEEFLLRHLGSCEAVKQVEAPLPDVEASTPTPGAEVEIGAEDEEKMK
jgi:dipeptidyl-peptidase 4